MADEDPVSIAMLEVSGPGRELAAHALLEGASCTQMRTSALLGTSRRTLSLMADVDPVAAWHDPQLLPDVRTCLAETARRGSTADERDAAGRWLDEAEANATPAVDRVRRRRRRRHVVHRLARPRALRPVAIPTVPAAPLVAVDALRRQQQRILHRSALIDYVLATERQSGLTLTLGDALAAAGWTPVPFRP